MVEEPDMTVCTSVKTAVDRHEWIADLFSVMAVALLFGTVWALIQYYDNIWAWIRHAPLVAMPVVVLAAITDILVIYGLLCAGSQRCEDGKCFRTFRGRRHGSPGGNAFSHWLKHMERVGKFHR